MAFVRVPEYTVTSIGRSCFFCTSSRSDKNPIVIDCQRSVSYEGSVYVCGKCATHLGEAAGAIAEKTAKKLQAERDDLAERVSYLEERTEMLDVALRAVRAVDSLAAQ